MIEIRKFVQEASRLFIEIGKLGANLQYLDLGGGLGVDYTGENSSSSNSINYSLDEYCYSLVETVAYEMDDASVPHPTIVTESGRACVAQSSMLLFNVNPVSERSSIKSTLLKSSLLAKELISLANINWPC